MCVQLCRREGVRPCFELQVLSSTRVCGWVRSGQASRRGAIRRATPRSSRGDAAHEIWQAVALLSAESREALHEDTAPRLDLAHGCVRIGVRGRPKPHLRFAPMSALTGSLVTCSGGQESCVGQSSLSFECVALATRVEQVPFLGPSLRSVLAEVEHLGANVLLYLVVRALSLSLSWCTRRVLRRSAFNTQLPMQLKSWDMRSIWSRC